MVDVKTSKNDLPLSTSFSLTTLSCLGKQPKVISRQLIGYLKLFAISRWKGLTSSSLRSLLAGYEPESERLTRERIGF